MTFGTHIFWWQTVLLEVEVIIIKEEQRTAQKAFHVFPWLLIDFDRKVSGYMAQRGSQWCNAIHLVWNHLLSMHSGFLTVFFPFWVFYAFPLPNGYMKKKQWKTLSLVRLVACFEPLVNRWATDWCVFPFHLLAPCLHHHLVSFSAYDSLTIWRFVREHGEECLYCASLRPSRHTSLYLSYTCALSIGSYRFPKG